MKCHQDALPPYYDVKLEGGRELQCERTALELIEEVPEGPALTNETLRDWVYRWCGGDTVGLPHISTWNTSKVTDMSYLFAVRQAWMDGESEWDCSVLTTASFNDDISAWDTSSVTTMACIFVGQSLTRTVNGTGHRRSINR